MAGIAHRPALAALCLALAACRGLPEAPAAKQSHTVVQVVGSSSTAAFARAWAAQFTRTHPEIEVHVVSSSSAAAPAALAEDLSAIGMMSRPIADKERDTISKRHGRAPVGVRVAMDAIGIYVFKDNPLKSISLPDLERIYAAQPRSGARLERWGELSGSGAWASRPMVAFGLEPGRGAYEVMRELVLGSGTFRQGITTEPVSTSIVQAVAMEPGAIAYASVYFRTARTRMLAVRAVSGEPVMPSEEAIAAGDYPLARPLYFYFNTEAGPATREFLAFVQSEDGRQIVRAAGGIPVARQ